MDQDWPAVSRALAGRLAETGMTLTDLANKAQVSLTTVRELVHNLSTRRRNPRTLTALSIALGWPENHLNDVLHGRGGQQAPAGRADPVIEELRALRGQLLAIQEQLTDITARLSALERR